MTITGKERSYLREIAKEQLEIAELPVMKERIKLWTDHNDLKGTFPPVTFEMWTVGDKGFIPECVCESEDARRMEYQIKTAVANHKMVGDDVVVTPEFVCRWASFMEPFDMPEKKEYIDDSIGFHIIPQIVDLAEDMYLIKKSRMEFYPEFTKEYFELAEDVLGDILTVRYGMNHVSASLTNNIVQRMTMENMFISVLDEPDNFKRLMDSLSDDYVLYIRELEKRDMLWSNNGNDHVSQGTWAFTNSLPGYSGNSKKMTMKDCWGYMDSQETVGISPEMFEEFFFPYYKKIGDCFGLLSYGCCEPVHTIWDNCLSKMDNLRKVSISAWCDQQFMGERLSGSNTIFYRKPSPNYIGVEAVFDEKAFRAHIRETFEAARNCKLEFCFRDVYTLKNDLNRARRGVEIIKEEAEKYCF